MLKVEGHVCPHLKGARLGTPLSEMVDTNAMGRGTTAEVSILYISLCNGISQKYAGETRWSHARLVHLIQIQRLPPRLLVLLPTLRELGRRTQPVTKLPFFVWMLCYSEGWEWVERRTCSAAPGSERG